MISPRGYTLAELDSRALAGQAPRPIITADCSSPREIDDGIFVEPLPSSYETYRVGVCVADTSSLYSDGTSLRQALENTEAKYWRLPNGEQAYEPMIDSDAIKRLELTEGHVRSAMVVSFVVGEHQPPDQVEITFEDVEVVKNMNYKKFGEMCRYKPEAQRYGRASAFILQHLQFNAGGDDERRHRYDADADADYNDAEDIYQALVHVPDRQGWKRGSRINESFMVAAGHLVAKTMQEEGRPFIYRVHDTSDESFVEFIPTNVARFSTTPGPHEGLNLEPYGRVPSPLRRLEDFVANHQLKNRAEGKPVTPRDYLDVASATQRLNQNIVTQVGQGPLRTSPQEIFGNASSFAERVASRPKLHLVYPEAETA